MNWRDFLTEAEVEELSQIERSKKAGQQQARRIYDRCRKRMAASGSSEPGDPISEEGKNG